MLAEQVGFALFAEVGFDDARAAATDGRAVGQADFQRFAGCVGVNGHQAGHAAAFGVFAAHGVARAFRRHHDDVDAFFRLDQAEVHVQAVRECDRGTRLDVVVDVFLVGLCLKFIGHGEHDDVAPCGRFGDTHNLQAFTFGFLGRGRAFAQGNNKVLGARVAQVQRVGVALGAVAQDGDFLVLDQVDVAIAIVIDAHFGAPSIYFVSGGGA